MLQRDSTGCVGFCCDECGDGEQTSTTDFSAALEEVRNLGWTSFKRATGDWEHFCPDCSKVF